MVFVSLRCYKKGPLVSYIYGRRRRFYMATTLFLRPTFRSSVFEIARQKHISFSGMQKHITVCIVKIFPVRVYVPKSVHVSIQIFSNLKLEKMNNTDRPPPTIKV